MNASITLILLTALISILLPRGNAFTSATKPKGKRWQEMDSIPGIEHVSYETVMRHCRRCSEIHKTVYSIDR